jgi:hypothetical protein
MATVHISMLSRLAPEHVLAAGYDFSTRRAEVFPAVSLEHLEIHERGDGSADVTEGTPAGIGVNWERCRYDWSTADAVTATVIDSNVYEPGSSRWQLLAGPAAGGTRVEMVWVREFLPGARGRIFGTLFKLLGKPIFSHDAKRILRNIERQASAGA